MDLGPASRRVASAADLLSHHTTSARAATDAALAARGGPDHGAADRFASAAHQHSVAARTTPEAAHVRDALLGVRGRLQLASLEAQLGDFAAAANQVRDGQAHLATTTRDAHGRIDATEVELGRDPVVAVTGHAVAQAGALGDRLGTVATDLDHLAAAAGPWAANDAFSAIQLAEEGPLALTRLHDLEQAASEQAERIGTLATYDLPRVPGG